MPLSGRRPYSGEKGVRADFILSDGEPAIDVVRHVETTQREQRADGDGAALHVFVHLVHALMGLQINTPRVKTNTLADQSQFLA